MFQIWNEANVKGFWSGTPQQMADLTKAAHDVVDDGRAAADLVAPALVTRLTGQRAWIDEFYATRVDGAPVADFVDVVSLQLYPDAEGTPESSMELLDGRCGQCSAGTACDKPIWNTEINYGLTGGESTAAASTEQQMQRGRAPTCSTRRTASTGSTGTAGTSRPSSTPCSPSRTGPRSPRLAGLPHGPRWMDGATCRAARQDADEHVDLHPRAPGGATDHLLERDEHRPVPLPTTRPPPGEVGRRQDPATPGGPLEVGTVPVMVEQGGMKVLVAHNRYRSALPSGENQVSRDRDRRLAGAGVEVVPYLRSSDEIAGMGPRKAGTCPFLPIYVSRARGDLDRLIRERRPTSSTCTTSSR